MKAGVSSRVRGKGFDSISWVWKLIENVRRQTFSDGEMRPVRDVEMDVVTFWNRVFFLSEP